MKTWIFIYMSVAVSLWFLSTLKRKLSQKKDHIDAIIPAYNEGPHLTQSPDNLLRNPYFCRVICVNDGSADSTEAVMAEAKRKWGGRSVAVTQKNTGRGGALMDGLNYATCDQVFLSGADIYVPPDQDEMGYILAETERGADAAGGTPPTTLKDAGLLPHICTTVKLPMIVMKHTLQQFLGGTLFIVSGTCGTFRTDVLRKFGFPDHTKIEDLDLTWTLVANDYCTRQTNHCIVYPQGCNSSHEEWHRWRRRTVGYAVCMCLRKGPLFSHFDTSDIFPTLLVVLYDAGICLTTWFNEFITTGSHGVVLAAFPFIWVGVICVIGAFSAWFHRHWLLVPSAPLSATYVLLAYAIRITYGFIASLTGHEPRRDKLTHYPVLAGASIAYSRPSVTGTERLSEA